MNTFALVQLKLEALDLDALGAALRGQQGMSPLDAPTAAKDAFGVLFENLPQADANRLQAALAQNGIQTRVVATQDIPNPPLVRAQTMAWSTSGLLVEEPAGKQLTIPWNEIAAVSLAVVEKSQKLQHYEERTRLHIVAPPGGGTSWFTTHYKIPVGYELVERLILAVTTQDVSYRLRNLKPEDAQPLADAILRSAPKAARSLGLTQHEGLAVYPSPHAFDEEIRWLLLNVNWPT